MVLMMAMAHIGLGLRLWPDAVTGYGDFSAFYTAATLIQSDPASLYNFEKQRQLRHQLFPEVKIQTENLPFYHPAFELLLYAPLAHLPYSAAYLTWSIANLVMLVLALWWLRPLTSPVSFAVLLLLSVAFFPIAVTFLQGQDSLLLLLVCIASFNLISRERMFLAGMVLALGLFKFHLVLPIVALLAAQRRWKVVWGFCLGGAALAAVSIALTGLQAAREYAQLLLQFNTLTREMTGNVDSQMPSAGGFLTTIVASFGNRPVGDFSVLCLSFAIVALGAYLARNARQDLAATLTFASVLAVLAGHHTSPHDLALLFPALVIASMRANSLNNRATAGVLAVLWCSPVYLVLVERNLLAFMFLPTMALFIMLAWQLRSRTGYNSSFAAASQ